MSDTIAEVRFGSDQEPGIRRTGTKRFSYLDDVTGKQPGRIQLERIRALAIPPAWTDVWISRDPLSHVQATGRDARGRKQYRYHPQFTAETAEQKFADLLAFAEVLGPLRRRVDRDLRRADLGHDQIVATIVRLLDATALRVGNEQYARSNGSFGLTTLRNRHATVRGSTVRLAFRGKSAHRFDVTVDSPRLARIVRRTQHLPGQALFEYRTPDGDVRPIGSADVNRYLAEHGHPGVTARTFRTWNATVLAADGFAEAARAGATPTARLVNEVIDGVADRLGNTRTVCRTSYIHPTVVESFLEQSLLPGWDRPVGARPSGLTTVERRTTRLLRRRQAKRAA